MVRQEGRAVGWERRGQKGLGCQVRQASHQGKELLEAWTGCLFTKHTSCLKIKVKRLKGERPEISNIARLVNCEVFFQGNDTLVHGVPNSAVLLSNRNKLTSVSVLEAYRLAGLVWREGLLPLLCLGQLAKELHQMFVGR